MSGHRHERVADLVRRRLAELLHELRDPRIGFVTLTEVKLSPDLRHARVFVTLLGQEDRKTALQALDHATPFLRRELARHGGLRYTPALKFVYDESADAGMRVEEALRAFRPAAAPPRDEPGSDEEGR